MKKITLYGATGFTGRLAAQELWRVRCAGSLSPIFRLCLAGRDRLKLEAVRSALGASAVSDVEIEVADSEDWIGLKRIAESSDVVLSTAGPYSRYGVLLVKACVESGAHYADITGETPFVRTLIDQHHEVARKNRVRIVPFCGFDSVPSDLGFMQMHREWADQFPGKSCNQVTNYFQVKGGFNGGTIATALELVRSGEGVRVQEDRNLLVPEFGKVRGQISEPAPDWAESLWSESVGLWGAPFFMAPINTRVVRRSQFLHLSDGLPMPSGTYASSVYQECLGSKSRLTSSLTALIDRVSKQVSRSKVTLPLLEAIVPKPGSGPSETARTGGLTRAVFFAEGDRDTKLVGRFEYRGDPGNSFTVMSLVQAGLCLLNDEYADEAEEGTEHSFGVLTPSTAFGHRLWARLLANGVTWQVSVPTPR